ncbi:MAG: hypothetical protein KF893_10540 [Caldilineaceae bacterium]|nr:hypothetical protein [Caldilineaceae bacterium]
MNKQKETKFHKSGPSEEVVQRYEDDRQQTLEQENKSLQTKLAEIQYWMLRSQEEERSRLATELHGGPIQELSSLLFEINTLERMLNSEECITVVVGLKDNLKSSIRSLRKFINTLHPPALAHFGLQPAIRSFVEQIQTEQVDLKIALFFSSEERLADSEVEWAIYRVLQECVQNVLDHAQAHNLMIRLRLDKREVRLEVEDDGIGFDVSLQDANLFARNQLGLFSARTRIETFGGVFHIRSAPGEGTTIHATVPILN